MLLLFNRWGGWRGHLEYLPTGRCLRSSTIFSSNSCRWAHVGDVFAGSGLGMEVSVMLNRTPNCELSHLINLGQPKDSLGQGGRRGGRGTHAWSRALEGMEMLVLAVSRSISTIRETPAKPAHPRSLCHNTLNETLRAFNLDLRRQVLSVN